MALRASPMILVGKDRIAGGQVGMNCAKTALSEDQVPHGAALRVNSGI